eukprot:gene17655-5535_t
MTFDSGLTSMTNSDDDMMETPTRRGKMLLDYTDTIIKTPNATISIPCLDLATLASLQGHADSSRNQSPRGQRTSIDKTKMSLDLTS